MFATRSTGPVYSVFQCCPTTRADTAFSAAAIWGGVSTSMRVDTGACGFRLGAFAILVRLRRREASFSLRNSALSSLNCFFNDLIFLSFFDIAVPRLRASRALA